MTTCECYGRVKRLLHLLFLNLNSAAAFPICAFHSGYYLQGHHARRRAFFSNSDHAHPEREGASWSTSKQIFPVGIEASITKFNHDVDDGGGDIIGSISDEPDVVLSGTPNRTFDFLKNEIGLSKKAMRKMTNTNIGQKVLGCTAANLDYKIKLLRQSMNMTDEDIRKVIQREPTVVTLSADRNVAPTLRFLAETLGLNQSDLRKIITRAPQILGLNTANLQAKIDFFVDYLDLSEAELRKMLLRHSNAFRLSVEKMQDTIGYLRDEVGLNNDELKRVVCLNPAVFNVQVRNLNGNVEFLQGTFPCTDVQLRRVIVKMPPLLTYSIEKNLQRKVEYLREGFDGDDEALRDAFLRHPALLGYSLEKRLRPRLQAILEAGFDPSILTIGIPMKEEDFDGWLERRIDRQMKKDPLW